MKLHAWKKNLQKISFKILLLHMVTKIIDMKQPTCMNNETTSMDV